MTSKIGIWILTIFILCSFSYAYCENIEFKAMGKLTCSDTTLVLRDGISFKEGSSVFDCATYNEVFMDNGCWDNDRIKRAELILPDGVKADEPLIRDLAPNSHQYNWNIVSEKAGTYDISLNLADCRKKITVEIEEDENCLVEQEDVLESKIILPEPTRETSPEPSATKPDSGSTSASAISTENQEKADIPEASKKQQLEENQTLILLTIAAILSIGFLIYVWKKR